MRIKIKKGLDIPIKGEPEKTIEDGAEVKTVAAVATDVSGIRPRMAVQVGDKVRLGQVLYHDKRNPEVPFTAPGAGEVIAINRGARRALQSVVIRLEGDEAESFKSWEASKLETLDPEAVRGNLIAAGLWTTLRTRPFSRKRSTTVSRCCRESRNARSTCARRPIPASNAPIRSSFTTSSSTDRIRQASSARTSIS